MRTLLLLAMAATCLSSGCNRSRRSPEERVRKTIDDVVKATRDHDVKRMVAAVSESYTDEEGNQKAQIAALVRAQLLLHPNLYLLAHVSSLACPEPTRAQVVVFAALASVPAGANPDLRNLAADVYRFELTMLDEDGAWRVVRAAWSPATVNDLL